MSNRLKLEFTMVWIWEEKRCSSCPDRPDGLHGYRWIQNVEDPSQLAQLGATFEDSGPEPPYYDAAQEEGGDQNCQKVSWLRHNYREKGKYHFEDKPDVISVTFDWGTAVLKPDGWRNVSMTFKTKLVCATLQDKHIVTIMWGADYAEKAGKYRVKLK